MAKEDTNLPVRKAPGKNHFDAEGFIINMGIEFDYGKVKFPSMNFLQKFMSTIREIPQADLSIDYQGINIRTNGPVLYVWNHAKVRRELQIQMIHKIYTLWFDLTSAVDAVIATFVSISYGNVLVVSHDDEDPTYFSHARNLSIRHGVAVFSENNLKGKGIIISDALSSTLLFEDVAKSKLDSNFERIEPMEIRYLQI